VLQQPHRIGQVVYAVIGLGKVQTRPLVGRFAGIILAEGPHGTNIGFLTEFRKGGLWWGGGGETFKRGGLCRGTMAFAVPASVAVGGAGSVTSEQQMEVGFYSRTFKPPRCTIALLSWSWERLPASWSLSPQIVDELIFIDGRGRCHDAPSGPEDDVWRDLRVVVGIQ